MKTIKIILSIIGVIFALFGVFAILCLLFPAQPVFSVSNYLNNHGYDDEECLDPWDIEE